MTFDAESFLNQTYEVSTSTTYVPVSEGEYIAMVPDEDKFLQVFEGTDAKTGEQWRNASLNLEIIGPDKVLKQEQVRTGMEKPRVQYQMFLDFTPEGALDMGIGKNVKLGRLREALKLNDPTKKWGFGMFRGKGPVAIAVKHDRPKNAEPGDDTVYARVSKVSAITRETTR